VSQRTRKQICSLVLLSVLASGCVSIDKRAWNESVSAGFTLNVSDRFLVRSPYDSQNLAEVLDLSNARLTETVSVSFDKQKGLVLRFEVDETEVLSKTYTREDGLETTSDGKIQLRKTTDCGTGDAPAIGCVTSTTTLFVNPDRDLIIVKSIYGAGLYTIIPLGGYSESFAKFPRKR